MHHFSPDFYVIKYEPFKITKCLCMPFFLNIQQLFDVKILSSCEVYKLYVQLTSQPNVDLSVHSALFDMIFNVHTIIHVFSFEQYQNMACFS
jgi:hypothetical protein